MYSLFARVQALDAMRVAFKEHIKKTGLALVLDEEKVPCSSCCLKMHGPAFVAQSDAHALRCCDQTVTWRRPGCDVVASLHRSQQHEEYSETSHCVFIIFLSVNAKGMLAQVAKSSDGVSVTRI